MNLISGLSKVFYWPVCRAYARYLGDRPADAILRSLCIPQFCLVNRFWPNFVHPSRFSEKIWSLQLHERDPKLTKISDKLRVRDYVASKVGGEYLIPLLWSGTDPTEIPYDELPSKFVIKVNHGCEYNIFVRDKSELNREKVEQQLKKWLCTNFGNETFLGIAWGYRNIKPIILIESFLEEKDKVPPDYKFWCFSGRVEVITVHFDRFQKHLVKTLDRNFKPYEFRFPLDNGGGEISPPKNYAEMVKIAESLAAEFDFMRVDLYNVAGKIYFGELTPYPGGVSARFEPAKLDFSLGEKWKSKFPPYQLI